MAHLGCPVISLCKCSSTLLLYSSFHLQHTQQVRGIGILMFTLGFSKPMLACHGYCRAPKACSWPSSTSSHQTIKSQA